MAYNLPGPKTAARLASGKKLFRHGLTYDAAAEVMFAKLIKYMDNAQTVKKVNTYTNIMEVPSWI